MQTVSRIVRQIIQERGIKQQELARLLGRSQSTISKKISGDYPWMDDELDKVIERYNIAINVGTISPGTAGAVNVEVADMKLGREDLSVFERVLMLKLLDCLRSSVGKGREAIIANVEYFWQVLPPDEKSDLGAINGKLNESNAAS